jgi:hypothetical protein
VEHVFAGLKDGNSIITDGYVYDFCSTGKWALPDETLSITAT